MKYICEHTNPSPASRSAYPQNFYLPWGKSSDSLYFTINFYPDYYRDGTIKKNGPNGPTVVSFTRNEKTGAGTTVYYDDKGNEIDRQTN